MPHGRPGRSRYPSTAVLLKIHVSPGWAKLVLPDRQTGQAPTARLGIPRGATPWAMYVLGPGPFPADRTTSGHSKGDVSRALVLVCPTSESPCRCEWSLWTHPAVSYPHRRSASARFSITQSPTISPGVLYWPHPRAFHDRKSIRLPCRGQHLSRSNQGLAQLLLSPRRDDVTVWCAGRDLELPPRHSGTIMAASEIRPRYRISPMMLGSCRWEGVIGGRTAAAVRLLM